MPSGSAERHAREDQLCCGANITMEAEPNPAPDFQAQSRNTFSVSLSHTGERQEEGEEMAASDRPNQRTQLLTSKLASRTQACGASSAPLPRHGGLHLSPNRILQGGL